MRFNHPQIALYQPEIPQNTGTIGRLAAACCCRLHIIRPTGFGLNDKNLKRAGLDYWPYLDLEIHDSIDDLLKTYGSSVALLSKFGQKSYADIPTSTQLLVFGQETAGLPQDLHARFANHLYQIPMHHNQVRSINLANAVSIVVYDQLNKRSALEPS